MTKSEELKLLAQQAANGENIDEAARQFANKYYPHITDDNEDNTSILDVLNGAYIARRFFGRSRFWYSKKINNNLNNGRPDDFTPEEWLTLKQALITISNEIKVLADSM